MDNKKPVLCVFCGSSFGRDPVYRQTAQTLGRLIAARGYSLIFGGGALGLMGETARALRDGGAHVLGILPEFLRYVEPPMKSGEELIVTPNMQERKLRMLSLSDAFIALPGGLGTYDEILDVLGTKQLGVHAKPAVLINTNNYYEPLIAAIDHVVREGFALANISDLYKVVPTAEAAVDFVAERLAHAHQPA
jgi:uncharacterized protein (TIGR00730 family)